MNMNDAPLYPPDVVEQIFKPTTPPQPEEKNVLELGDKIAEQGELARKRQAFYRAVEIVVKQLDRDALRMEESAIVGEHPLRQRHEIMDNARCLRVTQGWLEGLVKATKEEPRANGQ